jgi:hypothetical protein
MHDSIRNPVGHGHLHPHCPHAIHRVPPGLSFADCLEKSDLLDRAKEAVAALASRGEHPGAAAHPRAAASGAGPSAGASTARPPQAMTEKRVKLGGYDCVLKGSAACLAGTHVPDMAIVILHG